MQICWVAILNFQNLLMAHHSINMARLSLAEQLDLALVLGRRGAHVTIVLRKATFERTVLTMDSPRRPQQRRMRILSCLQCLEGRVLSVAVWWVDSGVTTHMTSDRKFFVFPAYTAKCVPGRSPTSGSQRNWNWHAVLVERQKKYKCRMCFMFLILMVVCCWQKCCTNKTWGLFLAKEIATSQRYCPREGGNL